MSTQPRTVRVEVWGKPETIYKLDAVGNQTTEVDYTRIDFYFTLIDPVTDEVLTSGILDYQYNSEQKSSGFGARIISPNQINSEDGKNLLARSSESLSLNEEAGVPENDGKSPKKGTISIIKDDFKVSFEYEVPFTKSKGSPDVIVSPKSGITITPSLIEIPRQFFNFPSYVSPLPPSLP
jgi:hypothetical protein